MPEPNDSPPIDKIRLAYGHLARDAKTEPIQVDDDTLEWIKEIGAVINTNEIIVDRSAIADGPNEHNEGSASG